MVKSVFICTTYVEAVIAMMSLMPTCYIILYWNIMFYLHLISE
jgi:hypothetical protein